MARTKIITGLDIGSSAVKALAAGLPQKEETPELLAFAQESSSGVRKGVVINPAEVSEILKRVLKKIEEKTESAIGAVYVNVAGSHIFSAQSRGLVSVSRADQKISQEDVERVLQAAQTISLPSNREILEVFPREFFVDGETGIKDPQGLKGVRLEAEVLVLGGFSPYIKNLTNAVVNCDLQINDLIFSPLASAKAVLTPREKELGVGVLDIGAGNTGLAVFQEGDLVHMAILPFGSGNITSDLAIYLKSDIDTAERVKLEFGTLLAQGQDKREKIELEDGENLVFSIKQISKVIEDRVAEIFGEVQKELKKIGIHQQFPSGIVLTGGGANLPKIREFAKKEFRLPCRLGRPSGLSLSEDVRWSTAWGLVLEGVEANLGEGFEEGFGISTKGLGEKIKRIFKIFVP